MQDDHFRDNHLASFQAKLAEDLRAQHDLLQPLPPRLKDLLKQLEAKARERETADARLYAELEESIAALIHAAPRKSPQAQPAASPPRGAYGLRF
jgi:hypothetical protein